MKIAERLKVFFALPIILLLFLNGKCIANSENTAITELNNVIKNEVLRYQNFREYGIEYEFHSCVKNKQFNDLKFEKITRIVQLIKSNKVACFTVAHKYAFGRLKDGSGFYFSLQKNELNLLPEAIRHGVEVLNIS